MSDAKFPDGIIVKAPNERAPRNVRARISIKRLALIAWLQQQSGDWSNFDVLESDKGHWYAVVNEWKPTANAKPQPAPKKPEPAGGFEDDDIPF